MESREVIVPMAPEYPTGERRVFMGRGGSSLPSSTGDNVMVFDCHDRETGAILYILYLKQKTLLLLYWSSVEFRTDLDGSLSICSQCVQLIAVILGET